MKRWIKIAGYRFRHLFGVSDREAAKASVDFLTAVVAAPLYIVGILLWRIVQAAGRLIPVPERAAAIPRPWIDRAGRLARFIWRHGGAWAGIRTYRWACCDRIEEEYVASPLAVANTVCFLFFVFLLTPVLSVAGGGAYYYGTWTSWRDVYVPNTGVYQSQNFVRPSGAGQVIAARDEIYTVLGKYIDRHGVEEVRFDIDYNFYFWFYRDAMRPDLAASRLTSQTQFGQICNLETTGIYARLPRFIRLALVRWMDLRPEIVRVNDCTELQAMPDVFLHHG